MDPRILDPMDPFRTNIIARSLQRTATYYYEGYRAERNPLEMDDRLHLANLEFINRLYLQEPFFYGFIASHHAGPESAERTMINQYITDKFLREISHKSGPFEDSEKNPLRWQHLGNIAECAQECADMLKELI